MVNNLQVVIDIIIPVFAIIIIGFVCGLTKIVSAESAKALNSYVLYVALPALLFYAVATAPIGELTNWDFLFANLIGILGSFIVTVFIMIFIFKKKTAELSIYGMNASYGTTGYMGLPLLIAAFGHDAALPAALATLIHNIPVIAIVIITFEWARAKNDVTSNNTFTFLKNVFKPVLFHPIMLSVLAGLIFSIFEIPLPNSLDIFASFLADAAGPTALFAIGLALVNQKGIISPSILTKKEVNTLIGMKLVFQPLLTIFLVLVVFDLEPIWALTTILMSALPIGAETFVFAQKYNTLTKETSMGIVISLLIAIVTISILFVILINYYNLTVI